MSIHFIVALLISALFGSAGLQQNAGSPAKPAAPAENPATTPAPREDEAWKQRHDSINTRIAQARGKGDLQLLFIGDSITQAWEGPGRAAWDKHFAPRGAANLGIGGDQTQHVIWRLQNGHLEGLAAPAAGKAPRLAVVMIGTNNLSAGQTPEQVAAGVEGVIEAIRAGLPDVQVLLLAILPRGEQPFDPLRVKVEKTNALLEPLAKRKDVHYLDTGAIFLMEDGTISPRIMPDFLHLSPTAYDQWAVAIDRKVQELLEE